MTLPRVALICSLLLTTSLAAQDVPANHRRPAVCYGAWEGCESCAEIAKSVRALPERYDERAAADVVAVKAKEGEASHRHLVRFFCQTVPRRGGTPVIDLNEVRVKLLWYDASGRPTQRAQGFAVLKIGEMLFNNPGEIESVANQAHSPVWAALGDKLLEFKLSYSGSNAYGVPVILDAHPRVPSQLVRLAMDEIAELYDRAFRTLPRAPQSPPVTEGWDPRSEFREYEEEPVREEEVEKPIIILEEEVEGDGEDSGETPDVVDAYGVGGGAAGAYGQRWGKGSLAREGGSEGTESTVSAALLWLKLHQSPDGRWDSDGWSERCTKGGCQGPGTAHGDARYDVGVTALAVLAFTGNGHSHRFGTYKRTVARALTWLKRQQRGDGSVGFENSQGESIYNHALATQALCEAYAIPRDFTLKRYAEKAVEFVVAAQNPMLGWKYGARSGRNDTSVTCAMTVALKAAKTSGIDVPDAAFEGARSWLIRATDSAGSVGYETPGGGSAFLALNDGKFDMVPVLTAASVFVRRITGERASEDAIRKGVRRLKSSYPEWSPRKLNFYYWYYGTYAMFQVGGDAWKNWNEQLQRALLPNQRVGGCEDGSWDPSGEWCLAGGRVYATAINALSLEVYYRYERASR